MVSYADNVHRVAPFPDERHHRTVGNVTRSMLVLWTLLGIGSGCVDRVPDQNSALSVVITQWQTETDRGTFVDAEPGASCIVERIESCVLRICHGNGPTAGEITIDDGLRGMPIILRPVEGVYPRLASLLTFEPNIDFDVQADGLELPGFRIRTSFESALGLPSSTLPSRIGRHDSLRFAELSSRHAVTIEAVAEDVRAVCSSQTGDLQISAAALDRMFGEQAVVIGMYAVRLREALVGDDTIVVETRNGIQSALVRE